MCLSEEDFQSTVSKMRLSDRSLIMAHSYLVDDGKSAEVVGLENGVSTQAAYKAAKKVFQHYLSQNKCPAGWKVITLRCPAIMAEDLKKQEQKMIEEFYLNNEDSK